MYVIFVLKHDTECTQKLCEQESVTVGSLLKEFKSYLPKHLPNLPNTWYSKLVMIRLTGAMLYGEYR
jgi:hypothetical protein